MSFRKLLGVFILFACPFLGMAAIVPPGDGDGDSYEYFVDVEKDIIYIDFETIKVNVRYIVVRDEEGKEVMRMEVSDVPVNGIYELDLTKVEDGKYKVELHSWAKVLSREVELS